LHDPISNANWSNLYKVFPAYQISILIDDEIAGIANCIPLYWNDTLCNLPEEGWDWALQKGFQDYFADKKSNMLCGLQIGINPKFQGKGLSYIILKEIKKVAHVKGYNALIIPVRPNQKNKYSLIPIDSYIKWKGVDGLPFDSWLRVHIKLGAELIKVCHRAMYITGKIAEWEEWTGLKFIDSGDYIVEGALNPIKVNHLNDMAEYIEPNVWIYYKV
jgi:GNAT superfamily N-acetyltransferase